MKDFRVQKTICYRWWADEYGKEIKESHIWKLKKDCRPTDYYSDE